MESENPPMTVSGSDRGKTSVLNLHFGEVVEVREENEILETLDAEGTVEGLRFMPTMYAYCRMKFKVLRRADKIMIEGFGIRSLRNTVILEGATCNGETQGCRRTCFILWKEAWLKRTKGNVVNNEMTEKTSVSPTGSNSEQNLRSSMVACQSRNLVDASMPLSKWSIRRYLYDFTSGVYRPSEYLRTVLVSVSLRVRALLTRTKLGSYSGVTGKVRRTPTCSLGLQPGDTVKVKNKDEILRTLDHADKNRGLEFTPEMERHCGETFQVLKRLDKMIIEQTGEMRQIANTVLLEGAFCDGKAHKGCPRNCYCLWREIWLDRV